MWDTMPGQVSTAQQGGINLGVTQKYGHIKCKCSKYNRSAS